MADPNWRIKNAEKGREMRTFLKECKWARQMRANGWQITPPQGKEEPKVLSSSAGES